MNTAVALMITGTVGISKSTTAAATGELLTRQGIPHAVIDTDDIRRSWPTPPDDPSTPDSSCSTSLTSPATSGPPARTGWSWPG